MQHLKLGNNNVTLRMWSHLHFSSCLLCWKKNSFSVFRRRVLKRVLLLHRLDCCCHGSSLSSWKKRTPSRYLWLLLVFVLWAFLYLFDCKGHARKKWEMVQEEDGQQEKKRRGHSPVMMITVLSQISFSGLLSVHVLLHTFLLVFLAFNCNWYVWTFDVSSKKTFPFHGCFFFQCPVFPHEKSTKMMTSFHVVWRRPVLK